MSFFIFHHLLNYELIETDSNLFFLPIQLLRRRVSGALTPCLRHLPLKPRSLRLQAKRRQKAKQPIIKPVCNDAKDERFRNIYKTQQVTKISKIVESYLYGSSVFLRCLVLGLGSHEIMLPVLHKCASYGHKCLVENEHFCFQFLCCSRFF